jgi:hypothetical protein
VGAVPAILDALGPLIVANRLARHMLLFTTGNYQLGVGG